LDGSLIRERAMHALIALLPVALIDISFGRAPLRTTTQNIGTPSWEASESPLAGFVEHLGDYQLVEARHTASDPSTRGFARLRFASRKRFWYRKEVPDAHNVLQVLRGLLAEPWNVYAAYESLYRTGDESVLLSFHLTPWLGQTMAEQSAMRRAA
jgi:hypothetical protein